MNDETHTTDATTIRYPFRRNVASAQGAIASTSSAKLNSRNCRRIITPASPTVTPFMMASHRIPRGGRP